MFGKGSEEENAYLQVTSGGHEAKFSHELIAGAASYEAAKAYENHLKAHGQPVSHEKAKELLAGFSGAFIDRFVETKGMDAFDRERAKHDAQRRTQAALAQSGMF